MSKPDKPLLSLGARGTIADSLTFQKRGREHIVRKKPIPRDPKSPAQLARRQIYRDAVASWHSLTPEEKETWRGVCPGLTAYQCFMSSELVYVPPPPPIPIDIGSPAIDRASNTTANYTTVDKNNPANASGQITSIEFRVQYKVRGLIVGTFYSTNGNTLKCRASEVIPGDFPTGSTQTKAVTIDVREGDYIGFYETSGRLERDTEGFAGIWGILNKHIDPGDEYEYDFFAGDALSLYGRGEGE
ncbi:hypothetical protein ES708_12337 [subsurface metagenome]